MQGCLAAGVPFVFGFSVYDSFEGQEVARTGVVPLPPRAEHLLGGHAVLAVGYDDESQRFIVRNSWGTGWGMDGYCTMPYGYLTDPGLARDFWAVHAVEKPAAACAPPNDLTSRPPAPVDAHQRATGPGGCRLGASQSPSSAKKSPGLSIDGR